MKYPKINLTIEKLRALKNQPLTEYRIPDCDFIVEQYDPQAGGRGHFAGSNHTYYFNTMEDVITTVINRADLPEEMFYYPDALATCEKIKAELRHKGLHSSWTDQLIQTHREPDGPVRARVCAYTENGEERLLAVLRDGTTIKNFTLLT